MMASSYSSKERTELCATAPCACESVHFMNGGCGGGLGSKDKTNDPSQNKGTGGGGKHACGGFEG